MSKFSEEDKKYMRLALKLAAKGRGATRPNPIVGAVIVRDGNILSTGYHKRAGWGHAEVEAIQAASQPLDGAKMYVTLEPCNTYGRTPPCTDQLIKHRFAEVIIGAKDPNPEVCGRGIQKLKNAGIRVRKGLLAEEAASQNEEFFKNMETSLPLVTSKIAASLDGKIAASSGDSRWITSAYSRKLVHRLRKEAGCVLTGIGTVAADNPFLFPRNRPEDTGLKMGKMKDFWRVVFDTGLKIGLDSNIARTLDRVDTIIFTAGQNQEKIEELKKRGAYIERTGGDKKIDIREALSLLYADYGITSVLLEAGPAMNASFLNEGQTDKLLIFFAPLAIGKSGLSMFQDMGINKISQARLLEFKNIRRAGRELLVTAYPRKDVYRNN
ncbi:MAG: bifunctional diaminohydroxyphosphoribosylaminopyrimidine deaminase/5-amino-6-(5-phosphoribosylamino)uracil reductase RibD [Actinomycetota bacterium]